MGFILGDPFYFVDLKLCFCAVITHIDLYLTRALKYNLRSGMTGSPLLFATRIFCGRMNFRTLLPYLWNEHPWRFDGDCADLYSLSSFFPFFLENIDSANSWSWEAFPSSNEFLTLFFSVIRFYFLPDVYAQVFYLCELTIRDFFFLISFPAWSVMLCRGATDSCALGL